MHPRIQWMIWLSGIQILLFGIQLTLTEPFLIGVIGGCIVIILIAVITLGWPFWRRKD